MQIIQPYIFFINIAKSKFWIGTLDILRKIRLFSIDSANIEIVIFAITIFLRNTLQYRPIKPTEAMFSTCCWCILSFYCSNAQHITFWFYVIILLGSSCSSAHRSAASDQSRHALGWMATFNFKFDFVPEGHTVVENREIRV